MLFSKVGMYKGTRPLSISVAGTDYQSTQSKSIGLMLYILPVLLAYVQLGLLSNQ